MTREEARVLLKVMFAFWANTHERNNVEMEMALNLALTALHPVSREQVEKVWRGEWALVPNGVGGKQYMCSKCGGSEYEYWRRHFAHGNENFCPHCGAPMTDEAVEMVMERLEAIKDAKR